MKHDFQLSEVWVPLNYHGILIYPSLVCSKCKEEIYKEGFTTVDLASGIDFLNNFAIFPCEGQNVD